MTRRVLDRGHYPAKRADSLVPGDIIVRPVGSARVTAVQVGMKSVFLRLAGLDDSYSVNVHKRRGTKVAIHGPL